MMKRLLQVARTEVLEQRRQPWMLFVLALNYVIVISVFVAAFYVLRNFDLLPRDVLRLARDNDFHSETVLMNLPLAFGTTVFGLISTFTAYLASTSMQHERQCGTLSFLMVTPLTRTELLGGKVLGVSAVPYAFHLFFVGAVGLLSLSRVDLGTAWWVAFLIGSPATALLCAALGTVISALSNDVRTSLQYTTFFFAFVSLVLGGLLGSSLFGPGVQVLLSVSCLFAAVVTLIIGAQLINRDVGQAG